MTEDRRDTGRDGLQICPACGVLPARIWTARELFCSDECADATLMIERTVGVGTGTACGMVQSLMKDDPTHTGVNAPNRGAGIAMTGPASL